VCVVRSARPSRTDAEPARSAWAPGSLVGCKGRADVRPRARARKHRANAYQTVATFSFL